MHLTVSVQWPWIWRNRNICVRAAWVGNVIADAEHFLPQLLHQMPWKIPARCLCMFRASVGRTCIVLDVAMPLHHKPARAVLASYCIKQDICELVQCRKKWGCEHCVFCLHMQLLTLHWFRDLCAIFLLMCWIYLYWKEWGETSEMPWKAQFGWSRKRMRKNFGDDMNSSVPLQFEESFLLALLCKVVARRACCLTARVQHTRVRPPLCKSFCVQKLLCVKPSSQCQSLLCVKSFLCKSSVCKSFWLLCVQASVQKFLCVKACVCTSFWLLCVKASLCKSLLCVKSC